MLRLPGWLVFLVFVPLQVWIFLNLVDHWGFWWSLLFVLVVGMVATRAGRATGLRALLFPSFAQRWEERRHLYQGLLFLAAVATFTVLYGPGHIVGDPLSPAQRAAAPWVGGFLAASAVKAAVR